MALERLRERVRLKVLRATQHAESLVAGPLWRSEPTPLQAQVIGDLESDGVHVTTLDQLLPGKAGEILAKAADFIARRSGAGAAAVWKTSLASEDLTAEALLEELPEAYFLGLAPEILDLVQRYLRLPAAYHGAVLRHSLVNGQNAGPRLWHEDAEDFHVFRMLVYLNDVGYGGGPFEYIPRPLGDGIRRRVSAAGGTVSNDRMKELMPETAWKRVIGPAGTVVMCDTARVFHHESLQTERDRYVVMIGYSSRRPKNLELTMAHFPVERLKGNLSVTVPQTCRQHVFGWRRTAVRS